MRQAAMAVSATESRKCRSSNHRLPQLVFEAVDVIQGARIMAEAIIFDALRAPRGKGRKDGSLYEVKPVTLLSGLVRELKSDRASAARRNGVRAAGTRH